MELDYKVTAIYVLACVVFLRKKGFKWQWFPSAFLMLMQVRYFTDEAALSDRAPARCVYASSKQS